MVDTQATQTHSIVIVSNGNYFALKILKKILILYKRQIAGIVIINGDYKGRTGIKAIWELSKVTAIPYLVYKIFSILIFRATELFFPSKCFTLERYAKLNNIPIKISHSTKSPAVFDWISHLAPDLLISVSCPQLIGRKLLDLPTLGAINVHSSLLPKYAGLAPYFWVLSHSEQETGITVHYMTVKFDEGNILQQQKVLIEPNESAFHLFDRLAQIGQDILVQSVMQVYQNDPGKQQDLSEYSYFSNPTLISYIQLRKKGHCLIHIKELLLTIQNGM